MPAFWQFWAKAEHADRPTQIKLFKEIVIAQYPKLYTQSVILYPESMTLDDLLDKFLETLPPLIPKMHELSDTLAHDMPGYIAEFMKTFPDYKPDTPIYFLASARGFDGAVREIDGKPALMFGIDVIARVHGTDDLPAFFEHELFHRYHAQAIGEGKDELWFHLWEEGLATYVSHALNPAVSESKIFGIPPDLAEQARPNVKQIAAEMLKKTDSTSDDVNRRYFLGGSSAPTDIPVRSGYYVGYVIAENTAKTKSLIQLAHLHGPELHQIVLSELKKLAGD